MKLLRKIDPVLMLILAVAFGLRFWNLGKLPAGFASDEVMNGYVGRYIFENGFDLYGNRWPVLYFDHFGDYPNVVPMYLSGLFTYIFGVNEFAVRFPIALAGGLTTLTVYLLARWLWKQKWPAYMAALAITVMPWHIVLSRATAEGITASLVFLIGLFLVFKGIEADQWEKMVAGWGLAFSTYLLYPGFRVFVPLAFLPSVFLVKKSQKKLMVILSVVLLTTTFLISQTVWGKGRFEQTSLFNYNNLVNGKANAYSIGLGEGKIVLARIFSNRYVLVGREFIRQYFSYFSPSFLTGEDVKPPRYFVPEHGVSYWSLLLVFLFLILKQFVSPLDKPTF